MRNHASGASHAQPVLPPPILFRTIVTMVNPYTPNTAPLALPLWAKTCAHNPPTPAKIQPEAVSVSPTSREPLPAKPIPIRYTAVNKPASRLPAQEKIRAADRLANLPTGLPSINSFLPDASSVLVCRIIVSAAPIITTMEACNRPRHRMAPSMLNGITGPSKEEVRGLADSSVINICQSGIAFRKDTCPAIAIMGSNIHRGRIILSRRR